MTLVEECFDPLIAPGDPKRHTEHIMALFEERHGRSPTVVSSAPGRVNLMGEHTDYNGGLCLPIALPHATYVAAAARDDSQLSIYSAQAGEVFNIDLSDLSPERLNGWPAYAAGVLWALLKDGLSLPGMDLVVETRVPVGAGLSSSASLQCAVALAASALLGKDLDEPRRLKLVSACLHAEHEVVGAPVGGMDQTVVLLAEAGQALMLDFGDDTMTRVPWLIEGVTILVIDTTVRHSLSDGQYASRRMECREAAVVLGVPELRSPSARPGALARIADESLRRRARHVLTENLRVIAAREAIIEQDMTELGRLMNESHESLRDDFEVSCPELDLVVSAARAAGALGARMTGGGFGGSAIALVEHPHVQEVIDAVTSAAQHAQTAAPVFLVATPAAGARILHSHSDHPGPPMPPQTDANPLRTPSE